jgi:hypothetical protein
MYFSKFFLPFFLLPFLRNAQKRLLRKKSKKNTEHRKPEAGWLLAAPGLAEHRTPQAGWL